jgi:predicted transcriptional regulator
VSLAQGVSMPESASKARRVRHDIVSEILEMATKGAPKTRIMYRTNLSYSQFKKYLNALEKASLIREESGVWHTTESGVKLVEACRICKDLMRQIAINENR